MEEHIKKYIKTNRIFMIVWTLLAIVYLWFGWTSTIWWYTLIQGMLFGFTIGMILNHWERNREIKLRSKTNELYQYSLNKLSKAYFEMANKKQKLEQQLKKYKGGKK